MSTLDPTPAGGLDVLDREDTDARLSHGEPGDHERMAHYVDKRKMTDAYVFGQPITALCGKKWVPSRNPEKYPVCGTCQEILDAVFPPTGGSDS